LANATQRPRRGFRTTEPERFRIDTDLSGKVKEREIFVPETIKKRLGAALTCPGARSVKHPLASGFPLSLLAQSAG